MVWAREHAMGWGSWWRVNLVCLRYHVLPNPCLPEAARLTERACVLQDVAEVRSGFWQTEGLGTECCCLREATASLKPCLPEAARLTERACVLQDGAEARSGFWQTAGLGTECFILALATRLRKPCLPEAARLTERAISQTAAPWYGHRAAGGVWCICRPAGCGC
jgi:hypothetical protein